MQYLDPFTQHPTKAAMQKVIDRFQTVVPAAKKEKNSLNMGEAEVNCRSAISCGMPHCVGGWYYVASRSRTALRTLTKTFGKDFYAGAVLMARDLGFKSNREFETWATKNAKIWGNGKGQHIFGTKDAWNNAKSLAGVVQHLKRVQRRLPA